MSGLAAIHHDGFIFLKFISSSLVLNVVSDTLLFFFSLFTEKLFSLSVVRLGEEGMHLCTYIYILQRALRWSCLGRHCIN